MWLRGKEGRRVKRDLRDWDTWFGPLTGGSIKLEQPNYLILWLNSISWVQHRGWLPENGKQMPNSVDSSFIKNWRKSHKYIELTSLWRARTVVLLMSRKMVVDENWFIPLGHYTAHWCLLCLREKGKRDATYTDSHSAQTISISKGIKVDSEISLAGPGAGRQTQIRATQVSPRVRL